MRNLVKSELIAAPGFIMNASPLRAGAARTDITPPAGTQLAGMVGHRRPAETVLDPLHARAAVFESNGRKLCIVALDVTIINGRYTDAIRKAVHEQIGIEPNAIMVHATQTHNASSLGGFQFDEDFPLPVEWDWLRFENTEYSAEVVPKIVEAVRLANEALQPVEIGVGSGIEGRLAFNRRGVMRDGKVFMPFQGPPGPLGWPELKYMEGPMDPELGLLAVRKPGGELVTALLNYTCHPVHLFMLPGGIVSADWCGVLCDTFAQTNGANATPLLLNGCCGNINPWDPYDPNLLDDHRAMGETLATTAGYILKTLEWTGDAVLDWSIRTVKLPFREIPPADLDAAMQFLETHPAPYCYEGAPHSVHWDWLRPAFLKSIAIEKQREQEMKYEIQVMRIGDTAFVGLPGEPFVEGQLAIKLASPTDKTYVVHCNSHYAGYIPTVEAVQRGGHEANLSTWAKLAPEALDMIVAEATAALHELFARPSAATV